MRISHAAALSMALLTAACTTTGTGSRPPRVVFSGTTLKVDNFGSVDPSCTSLGRTVVQVTEQPRHGKVTIREGLDYPTFHKDNIRAHCNAKRAPATQVFYTPAPGYTGPDAFRVEVVYPDGFTRSGSYRLEVR